MEVISEIARVMCTGAVDPGKCQIVGLIDGTVLPQLRNNSQ